MARVTASTPRASDDFHFFYLFPLPLILASIATFSSFSSLNGDKEDSNKNVHLQLFGK